MDGILTTSLAKQPPKFCILNLYLRLTLSKAGYSCVNRVGGREKSSSSTKMEEISAFWGLSRSSKTKTARLLVSYPSTATLLSVTRRKKPSEQAKRATDCWQ